MKTTKTMETKKTQKQFSLQNSPNLSQKDLMKPSIKSDNRRTTGFFKKKLISFVISYFKAIISGIKVLSQATLLAKRKTFMKGLFYLFCFF